MQFHAPAQGWRQGFQGMKALDGVTQEGPQSEVGVAAGQVEVGEVARETPANPKSSNGPMSFRNANRWSTWTARRGGWNA